MNEWVLFCVSGISLPPRGLNAFILFPNPRKCMLILSNKANYKIYSNTWALFFFCFALGNLVT